MLNANKKQKIVNISFFPLLSMCGFSMIISWAVLLKLSGICDLCSEVQLSLNLLLQQSIRKWQFRHVKFFYNKHSIFSTSLSLIFVLNFFWDSFFIAISMNDIDLAIPHINWRLPYKLLAISYKHLSIHLIGVLHLVTRTSISLVIPTL